MKLERFLDLTMVLGEGPVWDEQAQRLYWVDITAGQLWHWDSAGGSTDKLDLHQTLGMCALTTSGGLVLASAQQILLYEQGALRLLIDGAEADRPDNRFNDGKCDPRGRLLVGSMDTKGQRERGALYSLSGSNGQLQTLLTGVSTSNGIGFNSAGDRLYYVDTPTGFLWGFDYDLETGAIRNRQPLIDYRAELGRFDGITVDSEGMVWAAHWGGYQVSRWDPSTGRKLLSLAVPAPFVTSCCFGGPDFQTLYITSAWNRNPQTQAEAPLAGALFCVDTPDQGLPAARFRA